jgi:hypothetical protein
MLAAADILAQVEPAAPEAPEVEEPAPTLETTQETTPESETQEETTAQETESGEEDEDPDMLSAAAVLAQIGVAEPETIEENTRNDAEAAGKAAETKETENAETETEAAGNETEAEGSEAETLTLAGIEDTETEAEETEAETEAEYAETETEEPETLAVEVREKSKDEIDVETEGEPFKEDWIDSVGLEVHTGDGWNPAETENGSTIEVEADQMLRFHVTYTVEPETLSPEKRTLVYQIPQEIKSVEESYGEIVDADENVLANYSIDSNGRIHITFTREVAKLNEDGSKVTCTIEFRTQAANLVQ